MCSPPRAPRRGPPGHELGDSAMTSGPAKVLPGFPRARGATLGLQAAPPAWEQPRRVAPRRGQEEAPDPRLQPKASPFRST